jgi:hypothetical protein
LYPHQANLSSETKTISNYPTPLHPRRSNSQLSSRVDDLPFVTNHLMHRDRVLPQAAASNRLKTLRSLLFRGHKTLGIDPMMINNMSHCHRDLDSTLSEYHIRSLSQSIADAQRPKTNYEEQEDCVELKSECSMLTNRNPIHTNKVRTNHEPRQINSWDDI